MEIFIEINQTGISYIIYIYLLFKEKEINSKKEKLINHFNFNNIINNNLNKSIYEKIQSWIQKNYNPISIVSTIKLKI